MWVSAGSFAPDGDSAPDGDWRRSERSFPFLDDASESQNAMVERVAAWTCGERCCG